MNKFPRYVPRRPSRHALRLQCQVVRERDFKLVADEILELSETGLLVRPKIRILTGESLFVTFMAPYTRQFIDAEGSVARVLHGRRIGDGGPSVGVALGDIGEASRALLRAQLACLPSVAPRRRAVC